MAMGLLLLPFSIYFLISSSHWLFCVGDDRLLPGNPISINNQTVTSSSGTFALGFFSPGNSTGNSYVGIWYNSIPEKAVVWVANREAPLKDPSGVLAVTADGNIALLDGKGSPLWSTNLTGIPSNTSAVLLDSGNLVLRDAEDNHLWQSFDHPTDTYLPTLQLRLDFRTCLARKLVSWKDSQDPSPGEFSLGVDPKSPLQLVVKEGSRIRWRSWPWNARQTTLGRDPISGATLTNYVTVDEQGIHTTFAATGVLELSRQILDPSGKFKVLYWNNRASNWSLLESRPEEPCEIYGPCGPFGYCDVDGPSPLCRCLEGFEPKHRKSWEAGDFSGGCVRRLPLAFGRTDAFLRADAMKLPDNFAVRWNITAGQCKAECVENWRCTAYAFANFSGGDRVGSRCLIWAGDLIDLVRRVNVGEGLYVRVAASELDANEQTVMPSKGKNLIMIIIPTVAVGLLLMGTCCYFLRRRLSTQKVRMLKGSRGVQLDEMRLSETLGSENGTSELSLLDFNSIVSATNNFSIENKLGQGGFGLVYKGKLFQVHEVAVKRLSKCSVQGIEEFTNEVKLIAKLQHTNLVRLLGWCSHEEEKILVYEYMPNGSLDKFIFDSSRSIELDWGKRLRIIEGIANGLLYLHQYSRLRVIHRDLKSSNILLDAAMNPKISDFGLARIFGGDQTEANTERVVGTYGYMSPEYAMDGLFSEKSDVFSFGVMLLEIITGKRTTGFYPYKESLNLLGYVWQLWKEGRSLELMDPSVGNIFPAAEVSKCIQVGLLCVQEDAADRPSMSSIVFMLRKENSALPSPKKLAFAIKKNPSTVMTTGIFSTAQEDGNE